MSEVPLHPYEGLWYLGLDAREDEGQPAAAVRR